MDQKRVLLVVGGGVAAYKALELVRLLHKAGVAVRPAWPKAGTPVRHPACRWQPLARGPGL